MTSPGKYQSNERDSDKTRINENIRARQVLVIDENGQKLGVLDTRDALNRAQDLGLDLVEVAPHAKPPVCRIMDYGKYRYEQSKKRNAQSAAHHTKLKEIRLRPKTGEHDIQVKVRQAINFLKHRDKVQISVLFRGREMAHVEEGKRVLDQVLEQLLEYGKIETPPQQQGRRMIATVAPK